MLSLEKIRNERPIEELIKFSIINLDKPTGPTSFSVSDFIRRSFKINKTSHFGTLDPQVTGVLPVALVRACRLNDYFMHKDKSYVGIMRLHKGVSKTDLENQMQSFLGKINQLPPVRSSVKRAVREKEVKEFKILEINDKDVLFFTRVQAGTYIRKLIHDLGEKLGGAHMLELRRTQASIFQESESIKLYDFEKATDSFKKGDDSQLRKILIPADYAITLVLPTVQVKGSSVKQILTGKPLLKSDLNSDFSKEEKFAVFFKETFIGVYKKVQEKNIIARPEFVLN